MCTTLVGARSISRTCLLSVVVVSLWRPAFAERPRASEILPKDTVAYISIDDTEDLKTRFMQTAAGQMSQDPQLRPLVDKLYGVVLNALSGVEERVGVSAAEIAAIPRG